VRVGLGGQRGEQALEALARIAGEAVALDQRFP
jgi:hypothetical protein